MGRLLQKFVGRFYSTAPAVTGLLEALIFSAFFTGLLLSFYRLLGEPLAYAAMLASLMAGFMALGGAHKQCLPAPAETKLSRADIFEHGVVAFLIGYLALFMFFSPPVSDDEQRAKLMRMLLGVYQGSAWDVSRVDNLSVVYYFPSPYYLIYSLVEALRLPTAFYSIFSAALMLGSLLNLAMLLKAPRLMTALFPLALFFFAPEFLFIALSAHEEALIFFLSTRAAFWLSRETPSLRAVFMAVLCGALAIAIKPSTALFLPFALMVLMLHVGGKPLVMAWLRPKTLAVAALMLVPVAIILLIPDMMVSGAMGHTLADQIERISKYHVSSRMECGLAHFGLRLFEFGFDPVRTVIGFLSLNLSLVMPEGFDFMPKGCSHDDTTLRYYTAPNLLIRETVAYGTVPLIPLLGLFFANGRQRGFILLCIGLFLLTVALYSFRLMFWSGTARYFIVGMLILLPAFLLSLQAMRERFHNKIFYYLVVTGLLVPAYCVMFKSDISFTTIRHQNALQQRSNPLKPLLAEVRGPINIYFNDLLPYFTLMRLMPSRDVWLKREIKPDMANLIAIPQAYSGATNWHDTFYLLPIPSPQGQFVSAGPGIMAFGNRVPNAFFLSNPGMDIAPAAAFSIHRYTPGTPLSGWVRSLGADYQLKSETAGRMTYSFVRQRGASTGLCLEMAAGELSWSIALPERCRFGP